MTNKEAAKQLRNFANCRKQAMIDYDMLGPHDFLRVADLLDPPEAQE